MAAQQVDGNMIRRAIEEYGSLKNAKEVLKNEIAVLENEIAVLKNGRASLEKENSQRENQNSELETTKARISTEIKDMDNRLENKRLELRQLSLAMIRDSRQYELFQGFLAMIRYSTSVSGDIKALIASLQELVGSGWNTSKSNKELRSLFVRRVFGDQLKSFQCELCGTRFMVNPGVDKKHVRSDYECPACHYSLWVKPDDSFLKAMVSEEQLENVYTAEKFIEENKKLEPLKMFYEVKCEICGDPIQEWTEENITKAVKEFGWAHNQCWNSDVGLKKIVDKTVQIIKGEPDKSQAEKEQPVNKLIWPL